MFSGEVKLDAHPLNILHTTTHLYWNATVRKDAAPKTLLYPNNYLFLWVSQAFQNCIFFLILYSTIGIWRVPTKKNIDDRMTNTFCSTKNTGNEEVKLWRCNNKRVKQWSGSTSMKYHTSTPWGLMPSNNKIP